MRFHKVGTLFINNIFCLLQGFYTIYSSFGGVNQSFVASGSEDTHVGFNPLVVARSLIDVVCDNSLVFCNGYSSPLLHPNSVIQIFLISWWTRLPPQTLHSLLGCTSLMHKAVIIWLSKNGAAGGD